MVLMDKGTMFAFHQNSDQVAGQLYHLPHFGHRADFIQVLRGKLFLFRIHLRGEHHFAILYHSLFNSSHGAVTGDV